MKLTYTVVSASDGQAMRKATLDNKQEIVVPIDAFIVQLLPAEGEHPDMGSLKLVFDGADVEDAKKLFERDRAIELTFARGRKK